ncbi:hypothetical protein ASZ90_009267 [hydrocarbon metagenome]|uniref:Uncharacterized protein n=1 Tax=hydrocarbon metagenome TaxID=938273 RepID=A0A0W8FJF8_9ZZZZ
MNAGIEIACRIDLHRKPARASVPAHPRHIPGGASIPAIEADGRAHAAAASPRHIALRERLSRGL